MSTQSNSEQPPVPQVRELTMDELPLFWVTNQAVHTLVPDVAQGETVFKQAYAALVPPPPEEASLASSQTGGAAVATISRAQGRNEVRSNRTYGPYIARIARLGANLIASFDDDAEGVRQLNEIYARARQGSDVLGIELERTLAGTFKGLTLPAAEPLRQLRQVSQQIGTKVMSLATKGDRNDLADRYLLLKTLGGDVGSHKTSGIIRESDIADTTVSSSRVLSVYTAIGAKGVKAVLSADTRKGIFDPLIAADLIDFVEKHGKTDGDLGKINQLMVFAKDLMGRGADPTEVHRRMVEIYNSWPAAQQSVVHNGRQILLDRLDANLDRATGFVRDLCLVTEGDVGEQLASSYNDLAALLLRNITVTPQNRAEVMQLRTKRGRQTPRRKPKDKPVKGKRGEEIETDAPPEPLKLVTCQLNDGEIIEGVEGLIDAYLKRVSQGNVTLRKDIEDILTFMTRTDLPSRRRGQKTLETVQVRFGTNEEPDKLWDVWEMKPKDAGGLSTKTPIAKETRVYFIKLGDNTLGVIGIEPRSDQDAFVKSIRTKTKNRS